MSRCQCEVDLLKRRLVVARPPADYRLNLFTDGGLRDKILSEGVSPLERAICPLSVERVLINLPIIYKHLEVFFSLLL